LMVLSYGKGRVFHTTFGHDVTALSSVDFIVTFQRGTEWAATGGVTQNGVRVALSTPVVRYGVSATDTNTLALSYNVDFAASDALQAGGGEGMAQACDRGQQEQVFFHDVKLVQ